jgi:ubiquinone/menaquinone biosynthesis C-methylase UbiE
MPRTRTSLPRPRLGERIFHYLNNRYAGDAEGQRFLSMEAYAAWEHRQAATTWLRHFAHACPVEGLRLLDLACGMGGKTAFYSELRPSLVVGIDFDPKKVTAAQQYVVAHPLGAVPRFICGDAEALPLKPRSFDILVMDDCFEHFSSPETVLAEAYRVLRPGGYCTISAPPYYSKWGAHLQSQIHFPWPHLLFSEGFLLRKWKEGFKRRWDSNSVGAYSCSLEELDAVQSIAELGHLNKLTIRRFEHLIAASDFEVMFDHRLCSRRFALLRGLPGARELVATIACLLRKPCDRT